MGCNCYCGCDTRANRIKFGAFAALLTLCLVSLFSSGALLSRCANELPSGCDDSVNAAVPECSLGDENMKHCLEEDWGWLVFLRVLFWIGFIGFIIPLGMLCCCTKNPHQEAAMQQGVQMQTQRAPKAAVSQNPYANEAALHTESLDIPSSKIKSGYQQSKVDGYNALIRGQELDPQ